MSEVLARFPLPANPVSLMEDFKLAGVLGLMAGLATAAMFPYLLLLMPQMLEKAPLPLPALIAVSSLQTGVMLAVLSLLGLRMGHRTGLGVAWLRAVVFGRDRPNRPWSLAISLGLFAGLLIVAGDAMFAAYMPAPNLPQPEVSTTAHAAAGLLASLYGGVGEELQLRLFLMTLLVWLQSKFAGGRSHGEHFWIAIALAALLFGVAHLPAAAHMWSLDTVVVSRVVLLNSVGGVVFGWLYWRHGLETAMLAHFSADLILHVATPLVFG